MPARRQDRVRVRVRASAPWRLLLPRRTVRREVQGVSLLMPSSHLLPDYARARPTYGQNLVELAAGLAATRPGDGFRFLDVGANIGDSTLQVLARTGGRALAVEGDPYWAGYLQRNAGDDPRVDISRVLLTPADGDWGDVVTARAGDTTSFVPAARGEALPRLSAAALREAHPDFAGAHLIKSDTDGFDTELVPALARAWADSGPVLFFEFDPGLSRRAGTSDPHAVWAALASLGYDRLAVWDNTGDPLGQLDTATATAEGARLEPPPVELGYHFWDVAAVRHDDASARALLDRLVPGAYARAGLRT